MNIHSKTKRKLGMIFNALGAVFFQVCCYGSAGNHSLLKFIFCSAVTVYCVRSYTLFSRSVV